MVAAYGEYHRFKDRKFGGNPQRDPKAKVVGMDACKLGFKQKSQAVTIIFDGFQIQELTSGKYPMQSCHGKEPGVNPKMGKNFVLRVA